MPGRIDIDRLHLRLRGIPPQRARAALNGLGEQVLRELAQRGELRGRSGQIRLGTVQVGQVQVRPNSSERELRAAASRAVGDAIINQIGRKNQSEGSR